MLSEAHIAVGASSQCSERRNKGTSLQRRSGQYMVRWSVAAEFAGLDHDGVDAYRGPVGSLSTKVARKL